MGRRVRRGALRIAALPVLVALAVLAAACAPPPEPALPVGSPSDGLRVMTYNVLGAQADAAVFSEHAGWAARVDQLQPDVLVVQEAQSDDVAALRDLTRTPYVLAVHLEWECDLKPQREGVAVLVRGDLEVLGAGGRHLGGSCLDPTMRRPLVWTDLEVHGGPLRVYGTHLTAGEGPAAASRQAQIAELRATIAGHDPERTGRWVLAGDLNVTADGPGHRLVTEGTGADTAGPFVDAVEQVSSDAADRRRCPSVAEGDVEGRRRLWDDPALVARCGYSAGWPKDDNWLACDLLSLCTSWERRRDLSVRVRIDYVMFAADAPMRVDAARVPSREDPDWAAAGAEWYRLSDHLPVVVDLSVH